MPSVSNDSPLNDWIWLIELETYSVESMPRYIREISL